MQRIMFVFTTVAILSLAFGGVALAEPGIPVGGCPDNFDLHAIHMMGDADPMHNHIGNDADLNGDGFLCMKHVGISGSNHVHIDNAVPCAPKPERCIVSEHEMG